MRVAPVLLIVPARLMPEAAVAVSPAKLKLSLAASPRVSVPVLLNVVLVPEVPAKLLLAPVKRRL